MCSWLVRAALHTLLHRNDVTSQPLPPDVVRFVLATCRLGFLTIFSGFVIAVQVHEYPGLVTAWRRQMNSLVTVFLPPIFATCTGLRIDAGAMMDTRALMEPMVINVGFDTGVVPQPVFFNVRADGDRPHRHHHVAAEALAASGWPASETSSPVSLAGLRRRCREWCVAISGVVARIVDVAQTMAQCSAVSGLAAAVPSKI